MAQVLYTTVSSETHGGEIGGGDGKKEISPSTYP